MTKPYPVKIPKPNPVNFTKLYPVNTIKPNHLNITKPNEIQFNQPEYNEGELMSLVSSTPSYLSKLGLLEDYKPDEQQVNNPYNRRNYLAGGAVQPSPLPIFPK